MYSCIVDILVVLIIHHLLCIALQLQEILTPWRHTADEALATQIDVFEESHSEDDSQLNMPGGIDINSHEDMFNAVLAKVAATYWCFPM